MVKKEEFWRREKDLYRLARQRDRAEKNVLQVRETKNGDGNVLTSEESVLRRWRKYFEQLMNDENKRERKLDDVGIVKQEVIRISKEEVKAVIKRMKSGKLVGPDDIPVEAWRCLGEMKVEFLTRLFNKILEEKAYNWVLREELWYRMRKSSVSEKYVRVVQDMYENSVTAVKCAVGKTYWFKVKVGLHQGSALSPFLFAVVMDRLTDESREQVEKSLEWWRYMLERRGMKVSRKTVALSKRQEVELEVAELKMLRFTLGVTRMDRIRNKFIRGTAHVGRFGDKVMEARLRWFGHVQRRMEPPGRRKRGRPRRRFMDVVREDMQVVGVKEADVEDGGYEDG
ncbi:hypothetical protein C0J50_21007 [Silurus asotus]|uniref:Reverse transcriptase domain-containing protein n=1 Tax=Silurus asotus TaxID=30991 RepID=A0AAD5APG3_SILAS|nr:hypothetical protein C0J50_21007 [Silurus asotus]